MGYRSYKFGRISIEAAHDMQTQEAMPMVLGSRRWATRIRTSHGGMVLVGRGRGWPPVGDMFDSPSTTAPSWFQYKLDEVGGVVSRGWWGGWRVLPRGRWCRIAWEVKREWVAWRGYTCVHTQTGFFFFLQYRLILGNNSPNFCRID